jgi:ABC-type multidrug transport system fused ATPase/permease subunit
MPTLASDWHVGQVFLAMLWFFLFFIFIWLLIVLFADIFRSHDMGGWAKAFWVIGIIIFPFLGILIYLIARGGSMHERSLQQAQRADAEFRQYVQSVAPTGAAAPSPADELAKLARLKEQGVISDQEFERLKAQAVGTG